ncbi:glucosamine-fructose-6-phosphate aminotransferase [isomerizing] 2 [Sphaeroforma arctica JP610]|uniref:glutamine--fructose-6-phosphate transaminase (isomerizing) n=1 Tax=Sphaeroforma arctica JP610 TaxID=667725 RepID=A0A0L0G703_9EUKA|nr:glucosamine-fructose-6-phosphate aminotransferase [isomerizing] 2 [Sphaeroforma arctica JP610]KNC84812.1 glucosamine-fructose-6-phosphate aminotransferase [isomerizing] 2 [Sphaeroforma arctica JP610]|eukprot:XP_014158714.1 glucosamine-fructose-6-phosphate aminotransferase [isomerizing] 2 [Sphaeroforma arctica JP610]
MCGIFAYINHLTPKTREEIIRTLTNGLARLEYRGYDSAGIAIDGDFNESGEIATKLIKAKGKVVNTLNRALEETELDLEEEFQCHAGIAHTRWATHGEPSDVNSHPHPSSLDCQFSVVHNGIITNYRELKKFLQTNGYKFLSETDTEVIAKLIQYFYDQDETKQLSFRHLVEQTVHELEGAFALVFKSSHFPNEAVASRRGSPLLVGVRSSQPLRADTINVIVGDEQVNPANIDLIGVSSNNLPRMLSSSGRMSSMSNLQLADGDTTSIEFFLSSDASAIIEHTKQVIYLEDNDVAHFVMGEITIHRVKPDADLSSSRPIKTLEIEMAQIMRGNFTSFMQKEIYEQPESVVNTMRGRVNYEDHSVHLGGLVRDMTTIRRCRRLIFIACGTSYHSALAVRAFLEEMTEIPVSIELASDFMDRQTPIFRDDVCVFLSQSGETADTLNTLRYCKTRGALIVGITNTVGSTISRESDCGIHLNAGPEIGVASTKAYTSQIIALTMMSISMASDSVAKTGRREKVIKAMKEMPQLIEEVLKLDTQIEELSKQFATERSLLVMGRGYQYATCLEGALKIKELTYIHSEGILSGELKHGPLALIDEDMPVVMIVMNDSTLDKSHNALQQVHARGGRPIVICTPETEAGVKEFAYKTICIPSIVDCLQSILTVIPLQLMSYHIAVHKGLDVDCPRNLAKSVTVE